MHDFLTFKEYLIVRCTSNGSLRVTGATHDVLTIIGTPTNGVEEWNASHRQMFPTLSHSVSIGIFRLFECESMSDLAVALHWSEKQTDYCIDLFSLSSGSFYSLLSSPSLFNWSLFSGSKPIMTTIESLSTSGQKQFFCLESIGRSLPYRHPDQNSGDQTTCLSGWNQASDFRCCWRCSSIKLTMTSALQCTRIERLSSLIRGCRQFFCFWRRHLKTSAALSLSISHESDRDETMNHFWRFHRDSSQLKVTLLEAAGDGSWRDRAPSLLGILFPLTFRDQYVAQYNPSRSRSCFLPMSDGVWHDREYPLSEDSSSKTFSSSIDLPVSMYSRCDRYSLHLHAIHTILVPTYIRRRSAQCLVVDMPHLYLLLVDALSPCLVDSGDRQFRSLSNYEESFSTSSCRMASD